MRYLLPTVFTALSLSPSVSAKPLLKIRDNGTMIYDFALLKPSSRLDWKPCFDKFTCTILEVPLDYDDPSVGTTGVAFIKWSSNATKSSSTQDILINPGGPGGSGVQAVINALEELHDILGYSNNIVGMDPRGVNNSGPDLSCFPGRDGTAQLYDEEFFKAVDVNSSTSMAETFAKAGAFGDWCTAAHSSANDTAKYVNTVATSADMLHYAEVLAESKGERKTDAKLWYYGGSYGTVLGTTFAALFPDRIGRMILDAVVDVEDYYQGKWAANLPDTDAAIRTFFKYCFEAGREKCDFWSDSSEVIEAHFNAVVADLEANPIIVADRNLVDTPTIVTITDFKALLSTAPYAPSDLYPILAQALAEIEQRNGTTLYSFTGNGGRLDDNCGETNPNAPDIEPRHFIACNDGNGRYNLSTMEEWTKHVEFLVNQSKYVGEVWAAASSINCRNLNIRAPESQVFTGVPSANETSTPILFISNTLDPVTPLRAGKKMSALFGGSRILVQNSVGHGSLAARSTCTLNYTKQYIVDTSLPPEGSVCEAEEFPFKSSPTTSVVQDIRSILRKRYQI